MSVTIRFQMTGTVPGAGAPVTMRGGALTIGRGPENDMVLPDPERLISKRHCAIEDHGHEIVVIDLSTNGTYLNYAKSPLGQGPTVVKSGDVLVLGTYELIVDITQDAAAPEHQQQASAAPVAPDPLSALADDGDDFLSDILGGNGPPSGPGHIPTSDPLDALLPPLDIDDGELPGAAPIPEEHGSPASNHSPGPEDSFRPASALIPDDWEDDFLQPAKEEPPVVAAAAPEVPDAPEEALTQMPPHIKPVAEGTDPAEAFLNALGADSDSIPEKDKAKAMARLGQVMRLAITGLREILMTRSSIKGEFRMEQTQISSGHNNPLKFSVSPEQAIDAIVRPTQRGYLEPNAAVEEALNDIKAHEVAMITGMEAALKDLLSRLDPAEIVSEIETGSNRGGLLKGKQARYWEVYEKKYSEISDQAENDFQELFSKEFARAYQEQLDRLK